MLEKLSMDSRSYSRIFLPIILIVTCLLYWPSLQSDFVNWDDPGHLTENVTIRGLDFEHLRAMFTTHVNHIYIPLTNLSFAIEYHFFGLKPFVYHLTNLLLHLLNMVLIFILAQRLGLSVIAATAGTLLFGIHPIHVESVAWVTERKDTLYTFFYLLSLLAYLKHADMTMTLRKNEKARPNHLIWTTVWGVLSVLAKPMAISLPFILVLFDWFKSRRITLKLFLEKIPLSLIIAAIVTPTYLIHARNPVANVGESLVIWTWTFVFYLRQFLLPLFSIPIYRLPQPVSLANLEHLISLITFVLIVFSIWRFRAKRWFLFGFGYFFFSIFFLLRFDVGWDTNIVADRFMYLPSLGFCLWLGFLFEEFFISRREKIVVRSLVGALSVFIVLLFSHLTFWQNYVWKNSVSLWTHQLKFAPSESLALNNLATALRENKTQASGQIKEIIHFYEKAIRLDPVLLDAYYNLGNFYRDRGSVDNAIFYYQQGIKQFQKTPFKKEIFLDMVFNLGRLLLSTDKIDEGMNVFKNMIAMEPQNEQLYENTILAYTAVLNSGNEHAQLVADRLALMQKYFQLLEQKGKTAHTYFKLGYLYAEMKQNEKAIESYLTALDLKPQYVDALYNLGNVYETVGNLREALNSYEKVLKFNPRHDKASLNMGVIYSGLGNTKQAEGFFLKAIQVAPENADAYFNLGYIYEVKGELPKAREAYQRAVVINPLHSEAFYNLGNVYAGLKMNQQAIESYKKCVEINPSHENAFVNLSILEKFAQ